MKKETAAGIIIAIASVVFAFYIAGQYHALATQATPGNTLQDQANNRTLGQAGGGTGTVMLTPSEVAKHNSAQDCWLIIDSKIYDATSYLNVHPGGAYQIIPYCGTDATQAFATKGGRGSHSSSAYQDLSALYIGDINSQITGQQLNSTVNNINNQTTNRNSGNIYYEDDD